MSQQSKQEGGRRVAEGPRSTGTAAAPLVSVITVTRNARAPLEKAVASVLSQTYPHVEYIVVDGASTDGTVEWLRGLESQIDYWVSEPDEGIADAFSKGVALASGELIGLLNADDVYRPGAVQAAVDAFARSAHADVVCGALEFVDERGNRWVEPSEPERLERAMAIKHPATFVRARCYSDWGAFDASYRCAMDYELLLRFHHRGAVFVKVPDVIASMSMGGVSDTQWRRASAETARAQRTYGRPSALAALDHAKRLLDRPVRRALARAGLRGGLRALRWRRRGTSHEESDER